MNHANRTGLQGGIPGSAYDNPRAPITDFMANMMMAAIEPEQPQEPASATAPAAACAAAPAAAGTTAPAAGAEASAAAAESAAAGDSASQRIGLHAGLLFKRIGLHARFSNRQIGLDSGQFSSQLVCQIQTKQTMANQL